MCSRHVYHRINKRRELSLCRSHELDHAHRKYVHDNHDDPVWIPLFMPGYNDVATISMMATLCRKCDNVTM
jgi:hypothetical protein